MSFTGKRKCLVHLNLEHALGDLGEKKTVNSWPTVIKVLPCQNKHRRAFKRQIPFPYSMIVVQLCICCFQTFLFHEDDEQSYALYLQF